MKQVQATQYSHHRTLQVLHKLECNITIIAQLGRDLTDTYALSLGCTAPEGERAYVSVKAFVALL